jgi:two-component system OmpR family response regulator
MTQESSAPLKPSQHILVVDDDLDIRQLLGDYLRKSGFRATTVPDGVMMRKTLARETVDLVVLDIMLRGEDGLELCRAVRSHSNTPVIMLTARGDPLDRVIGLEMGADDYLAKPFLPRELLARIKTVLRRVDPHAAHKSFREVRHYRFAAWTLDTITRNLTDDGGIVVPLSGSEYRVLAKLLAARKRVLNRAHLADADGTRGIDPFDRSIDVCISRLRQILGEDAREPRIIKTVYGEGYVIGVDVTTT